MPERKHRTHLGPGSERGEREEGSVDTYIGVYRVQGRLGEGGAGEVLLAYDDRLKRPVAIKRLRHDRATPASRERLRREAQAVARLSHPAIVQVHDIVLGDDSDSFVMEYVEGRTLRTLLAEGGVDGAAALGVVRQVAEGLAAAHAKGFLHRDLKTENVMVTPEGRAKVLDFGLAMPLERGEQGSLTREGEFVGTLRAMSPEQARGEKVDVRTDLFSLGVMLYEVFTGSSPFRGRTPAETLRRLFEERPPRPRTLRPELPEELSALAYSLLEKDPASRPSSAAEVADRLAEIGRLPGIERLGPVSVGEPRPGLSDLPTEGEEAHGGRRVASAEAAPMPVPVGWQWRGRAAAAAAAVALLLTSLYFAFTHRPEPRRVLIVPVTAPAVAGDPALVALAVEDALISSLAALENVDPVGGRDAGAVTSPVDSARAAAADEVLQADLLCRAEECRVSLRRLRGNDGVVLRVAEPFLVPTAPEDARDLVAAIGGPLRSVFPEHRPRWVPRLATVRAEDHVALLRFLRRRETGALPPDAAELGELERLLQGSPGLLRAYPLAAGIARTLGDLERGLALLDRARELDPEDPRLLTERLRIHVAAGRLDQAAATLEDVKRLAPGQSLTLSLEAELRAAQGRMEEAALIAGKVVRRRPSWRNVLALADFEARLGRLDEARRHLEAALEPAPRNVWVLAKQAELELRYGDVERAEEIYGRLIALRPLALYHRNLGWVRYIRADYPGAAESYRAALALAPDHLLTRFNLATARDAAGEVDEARRTYRELLRETEQKGDAAQLGPQSRLILAQCRARTGDLEGAYDLAQRTMRGEPQDRQDLFLAAQVYALIGERLTALDYAERAIEAGILPRWFGIPEFAALRPDPRFQALLAMASGKPGA